MLTWKPGYDAYTVNVGVFESCTNYKNSEYIWRHFITTVEFMVFQIGTF